MCHLKKCYTIVLFYFPRFIVYILCLIIYLEEDYNNNNKKKRLDAVFMNQMIFWGKINNIYIYNRSFWSFYNFPHQYNIKIIIIIKLF